MTCRNDICDFNVSILASLVCFLSEIIHLNMFASEAVHAYFAFINEPSH